MRKIVLSVIILLVFAVNAEAKVFKIHYDDNVSEYSASQKYDVSFAENGLIAKSLDTGEIYIARTYAGEDRIDYGIYEEYTFDLPIGPQFVVVNKRDKIFMTDFQIPEGEAYSIINSSPGQKYLIVGGGCCTVGTSIDFEILASNGKKVGEGYYNFGKPKWIEETEIKYSRIDQKNKLIPAENKCQFPEDVEWIFDETYNFKTGIKTRIPGSDRSECKE